MKLYQEYLLNETIIPPDKFEKIMQTMINTIRHNKELLRAGKITQSEFNRAVKAAKEFSILKASGKPFGM